MARQFPDVVRREYAAGDTIGAHSQNHPLRFQRLSGDNLRHEIDDGSASLSAALGDTKDLAPFFRIPGICPLAGCRRECRDRGRAPRNLAHSDFFHVPAEPRQYKNSAPYLEPMENALAHAA
jgi:peptidoglycan/xylan/chitin deacetylase (PgdA/CDA1 family)